MTSPELEGMSPDEVELADEEASRRGLRRLAGIQAGQIALLLLAIVAIFSILAPGEFLSVENFRAIITNTAILCVLGVGMTYVIVTAGIDLSIGSVLVFSGVVASKAMLWVGGDGWGVATVGIVVAVVAGLSWGILNGLLISRLGVPALIVTLGTMGMALGFSQIITGGYDIRQVPKVLTETIGYGRIADQIPVLVVIAFAIVLVGGFVLGRLRFGLYTYAVGSNDQAARRVGIRADRHIIFVYALSGLMAGIGGILSLSFFSTTTISGQTTTNLNVIAGVVIGGTSLFGGVGTMFGTVIGLFIPAVLQNGFVVLGIQPFWQNVVVGMILIAAVAFDLRRRKAAEQGGRGTSIWDHLLRRAAPTEK